MRWEGRAGGSPVDGGGGNSIVIHLVKAESEQSRADGRCRCDGDAAGLDGTWTPRAGGNPLYGDSALGRVGRRGCRLHEPHLGMEGFS